jgi:hypothetical protein
MQGDTPAGSGSAPRTILNYSDILLKCQEFLMFWEI